MAKKYTFPALECWACPHHQVVGHYPGETRYCKGGKSRNPKRFKQSDPRFKAPKWCPIKLPIPVCRILGFVDERAKFMESLSRTGYKTGELRFISPLPSHYIVRAEIPLGKTAKQFYEATEEGPLSEIIPEPVESGEIIQIDDGTKPYYFYVMNYATVIPISYFQFIMKKKPKKKT